MSNYQRPIQPHPHQPAAKPKNSNTILIVVIVCIVLAVTMAVFACVAITVFSMVQPAVKKARNTALSNVSKSNLKLIGVALHNYHDANSSFPAAYSTSVNGQPTVSWRASILSQLGNSRVHESLDYSQPWDSPSNKSIADTGIPELCTHGIASSNTETAYVAIVHPASMFPPDQALAFRDCIDGTSNTIMVIEVRDSKINWLEPRDFTIDQAVDYILNSENDVNVLLTDGTVKGIGPRIKPKTLRALMTRNGKEVLGR